MPSEEKTSPTQETPMPHAASVTSDWVSTQLVPEAALVVLDREGSIIHELREKVAALDNGVSHLTALINDNFLTRESADQAIKISKQNIFDTAVKVETADYN
ncbi:unnamed protein product [Echinostoma caproni]|uniref:Dynein light chain n=1 Tax=Echinostoma caproni TaxID=27848 RepID=A0A183BAJ5_9TREM|nr:unnamed protein product [Echinostoma caproni]